MATRSKQNFLKGINRRFSRKDSVSPDFFYTLQNARLFNRGETGKVQRIDGYSQWNQNTTDDYTETLDVLNFNDDLIVLYQTNGNNTEFNVDVFDSSGALVDEFTFTSTYTTAQGSLARSSDVIFIKPFNKILYYDGTDYVINDYISKVPEIALAQQGSGNEANGTITPNSAPTSYGGERAQGRIRVLQNNTARGETDLFDVEFDGVTAGPVSVTYTDTEIDIAKKIYDALVATALDDTGGTSGTVWSFSMSQNIDDLKTDSQIVYIKADDVGETYNGIQATITGSDYNITEDRDNTRIRDNDINLSDFDINTRDVLSSLSSTIVSSPTEGGRDPKTNLGPLHIRFNRFGFTVSTVNVTTSDTTTTLANKIQTALDESGPFGKYYSAGAVSGDSVPITALEQGTKYNSDVSMFFDIGGTISYENIFTVSDATINITNGTEADETLTLKKDTDYWYKVRYRYSDGHLSRFSEPQYINTGASKAVSLTIQTPERDLDGGALKLQIYRKEESQNFFLIDEIDTDTGDDITEYTDDGEFNKEADDPKDNIWIKKAGTHDIVENRYVMGNISYFDENYTIGSPFGVNAGVASGDKISPINTKARVYMRPKYDDGTTGYHTKIGELDVASVDQAVEVVQNGLVTSDDADKTVEELALFANYLPQTKEDNSAFNSVEIANRNLAPISDPDFFPSTTRVFFGFKFLELFKGDEMRQVFKVFGWDSQRDQSEHGGFLAREEQVDGTFTNDYPQQLTVDVFGIQLTYIRWGYRSAGGGLPETGIYKLENFEALNDAASTGNLYLRLNSASVDALSKQRPDSEIYGEKVRVRKVIDQSAEYPDLQIRDRDDSILEGPVDSRIYLELEESPLDDIDNENVNKYTFRRDYSQTIEFRFQDLVGSAPIESQDTKSYTLSFELVNFQEASGAVFEPYQEADADKDNGQPLTGQWDKQYFKYNWEEAVYDLLEVSLPDNEDTLIYLGRKDNATTTETFEVTGFEKTDKLNINTAILASYNIYENIIQEKDLNLDRQEFTNQIIWSTPLISGETFGGGRTLENEAFFDIGTDNGELLEIKSLNNQLYAFCERGVGKFNIGEVLTQQSGGQVFVDSSRFIGDFWWIQYNLKGLKRNTVRRVQNGILYSDGYDVFRVGGQGVENITQGIIPLDPDNNYSATLDEKNFEYKLSDLTTGETWVYNYEFGQWYGPFTYTTSFGDNIKNKVLSVIGDAIVEHNVGNTFDGATFPTIIKSVANDTQESFVDKNYRKFYIQTENDTNAVFRYGKDFNSLVSKNIANMRTRNGYKHQGVTPTEGNNKVIFWELESEDDGFELRDMSWNYREKRRR